MERKEDGKEREEAIIFSKPILDKQFEKILKNKSQMGLIYAQIKSGKAQPKRHKLFLPWKS